MIQLLLSYVYIYIYSCVYLDFIHMYIYIYMYILKYCIQAPSLRWNQDCAIFKCSQLPNHINFGFNLNLCVCVYIYSYNVRPPRSLSWFITPITMVYGIYNELVTGACKPTNITSGGPTLWRLKTNRCGKFQPPTTRKSWRISRSILLGDTKNRQFLTRISSSWDV